MRRAPWDRTAGVSPARASRRDAGGPGEVTARFTLDARPCLSEGRSPGHLDRGVRPPRTQLPPGKRAVRRSSSRSSTKWPACKVSSARRSPLRRVSVTGPSWPPASPSGTWRNSCRPWRNETAIASIPKATSACVADTTSPRLSDSITLPSKARRSLMSTWRWSPALCYAPPTRYPPR